MEDIDIRVAKPEDAPIVQKYLGDSNGGAYIQEWLGIQSRGEGLLLLAWDTDEGGKYRPVGRVTLVRVLKEEITRFLGDKVAGVESLHVDEQMRRRGIGEKLMLRFEEEAKKRGFNTIQLGVERESLPAVNLYKKLGYKDWGHGQTTESWIEDHDGRQETVTVQTDVLIKNLDSER